MAPSSFSISEDTGGRHDNNGFALEAHPGESQGRPETTSDSGSISSAACPSSGVPPLPLARSSERIGSAARDTAFIHEITIQKPELDSRSADGRCGQVSDELRAAIRAERSKVRRRIRELRHVDERLALLERELEAGQRPRELIHLEPRKEDLCCAIARAASAAAARPAAAAANARATGRRSDCDESDHPEKAS